MQSGVYENLYDSRWLPPWRIPWLPSNHTMQQLLCQSTEQMYGPFTDGNWPTSSQKLAEENAVKVMLTRASVGMDDKLAREEYLVLQWMLRHYLSKENDYPGMIPCYTNASGNKLAWHPHDSIGPIGKLETLIRMTTMMRNNHLTKSTEQEEDLKLDILDEEEAQKILEKWKDDYTEWMDPSDISNFFHTRLTEPATWQAKLTKDHATLLWNIAGQYELAFYFLQVPFTLKNLVLYNSCEKMFIAGRGEAIRQDMHKTVRQEAVQLAKMWMTDIQFYQASEAHPLYDDPFLSVISMSVTPKQ